MAALGSATTLTPPGDLAASTRSHLDYYADGTVSAGPPPKPLPQYPVRVSQGQVEIQTSPIPIV